MPIEHGSSPSWFRGFNYARPQLLGEEILQLIGCALNWPVVCNRTKDLRQRDWPTTSSPHVP